MNHTAIDLIECSPMLLLPDCESLPLGHHAHRFDRLGGDCVYCGRPWNSPKNSVLLGQICARLRREWHVPMPPLGQIHREEANG